MKAPEKVHNHPRRKWWPPDREWLEHQVWELGKSGRQIADELGCSAWLVNEWKRNGGLRKPIAISDDPGAPRRIGFGCGARFVGITREWLYRQYVELDKSMRDIGGEVGISANGVKVWLEKFDIPVRTEKQCHERHSDRMSGSGNPAWNGGTARNYQARLLRESGRSYICEWCGATKRLQVHHRDHDRENGDLSNLAWLCGPCNRMEAQLWALQQNGRAEVMIDTDAHKIVIEFTQF